MEIAMSTELVPEVQAPGEVNQPALIQCQPVAQHDSGTRISPGTLNHEGSTEQEVVVPITQEEISLPFTVQPRTTVPMMDAQPEGISTSPILVQINTTAAPERKYEKVYYRRKFKVRVGPAAPHDNTMENKIEKRKAIEPSTRVTRSQFKDNMKTKNKTPLTVANLRRSCRLHDKTKGSKAPSAEPEGTKRKKRKILTEVTSHSQLIGKLLLPAFSHASEFPGLDTLEQSKEAYPEIPVTEIQNVEINRCRLSPSEVTTQRLLKASKDNKACGAGDKADNKLVAHG